MNSHENLQKYKVSQLKEVCREYNILMSGKKSELIQRIMEHEEKNNKKKEEKNERLVYGEEPATLIDGTPDTEFDAIITKFLNWFKNKNFSIERLSINGHSFDKVDQHEIRASFKDYLKTEAELRSSMKNQLTLTKTEIFINMFFDKLGIYWFVFDEKDENEIEFEYYENDFTEYMKL